MLSRLSRSGSVSSSPPGLLRWVAVLPGTWTKQDKARTKQRSVLVALLHFASSCVRPTEISFVIPLILYQQDCTLKMWDLEKGTCVEHLTTVSFSWVTGAEVMPTQDRCDTSYNFMEIWDLHAFHSWRPTLFEATVTVSCQWQSWPQWQLALSRTKLSCTSFLIDRM